MVSPVMALRSSVGWPRFSDPSLQGPLNIQAVAATACKGRNASTTGAMTATAIVAFISPSLPDPGATPARGGERQWQLTRRCTAPTNRGLPKRHYVMIVSLGYWASLKMAWLDSTPSQYLHERV